MRFKVLTRKKYVIILIPFVLLFLSALVVCPLIGSERISLSKALDFSMPIKGNPDAVILFYARIPRCLLALLVGAALASSGVTFQAMLKNPLATPYTLGLAGGSSLAAVMIIMFFDFIKWRFPLLQPIASFIGALATLGIVYKLGRRSGGFQHVTLILAGVTLNLFFSSLILLIQYIADPARTFFILHWLMGNLDFIRYDPVLLILPFQITGMAILFYHARAMNLLSLDEMSARSLGLDVPVVMRRLYIASSLVAGSAIAFSGPIGFVGLIVPHAIRLMVGADHRILLPASFLAGGAFLILCDTLARTVLAPTELPVGVITALLGGPFFLWLLLRQKKGGMAF
ncbi:iron ABC transporter permease [Candidatus Sumerlaeota bacterium]|nr:iron ABC transporter permease [Candidatus Sumerlaeota bacterium]